MKGTPPILQCPARKSTPLHTFTALPSSIPTLLAPRRTPAVTPPVGNTEKSIQFFTSVGFQTLSNEQYIDCIRTLKPDIAVGLADVPHGTTPGSKRVLKMSERTEKWFDAMIASLSSSSQPSDPPAAKNTDETASQTAIFAPILPTPSHSQAEYLKHLSSPSISTHISGLAFYNSSLLPSIIPVTATHTSTPLSSLPRLSLDEPPTPHTILHQIALGIDLFALPFLNNCTDSGLAFMFEFPSPRISPLGDSGSGEERRPPSPLPLAFDASSPLYTHATTSLWLHDQGSGRCTCHTCSTHFLGYIQHLLTAREMLGWTLLQIHNLAVTTRFFESIRTSIRNRTFARDRKIFEGCYEGEFPQGEGERPRGRGYHFKSEGKGEGRRNRKAWGRLGGGEEANEEGGMGNGRVTMLEGDMEVDVDPGDAPLVPEAVTGAELQEKGFGDVVGKGVNDKLS